MKFQPRNKSVLEQVRIGLLIAALFSLAASESFAGSHAGMGCSSDPSAFALPPGTQFILKKKIVVQESSHESEHFGRDTACSFWVGKPQSNDFEEDVQNGITFRPQNFVLGANSEGANKYWLRTDKNQIVTLYCDESAKITTLSTLRAALRDTFTIAVPSGSLKNCGHTSASR